MSHHKEDDGDNGAYATKHEITLPIPGGHSRTVRAYSQQPDDVFWQGNRKPQQPPGNQGNPVGLELLGRQFDESTLISTAAGYEAHTDSRMLPALTPPLDTADALDRPDTLDQSITKRGRSVQPHARERYHVARGSGSGLVCREGGVGVGLSIAGRVLFRVLRVGGSRHLSTLSRAR